jgi:hypothetical protein
MLVWRVQNNKLPIQLRICVVTEKMINRMTLREGKYVLLYSKMGGRERALLQWPNEGTVMRVIVRQHDGKAMYITPVPK